MKFFVSIVLSLVVVSSCVQDAKYLKQSELIKYAKHAPTVLPNLKANAPFDKLEFDKVIAYDFDGDYETYSSVIHRSLFFRKKKYVPVIINQNHLNQEQVNFVTSFLSDTLTYGEFKKPDFEDIPEDGAIDSIALPND